MADPISRARRAGRIVGSAFRLLKNGVTATKQKLVRLRSSPLPKEGIQRKLVQASDWVEGVADYYVNMPRRLGALKRNMRVSRSVTEERMHKIRRGYIRAVAQVRRKVVRPTTETYNRLGPLQKRGVKAAALLTAAGGLYAVSRKRSEAAKKAAKKRRRVEGKFA